jgi:C-terminal processing protease CtpA/Prc
MTFRAAACLLLPALVPAANVAETKYEKDVAYLLDQFETEARDLLAAKKIDWKSVRKEFTAAASEVQDDVAHVKLCSRLLARLKDGHADFTKVGVELPEEPPQFGVGLSFAEQGTTVLVKNAFGPARASGIESGFAVVSIDGVKAHEWVTTQARELSDRTGFSTAHAARYAACHWSLAGPAGTKFELEFDRGTKGKKKVTLSCDKSGGAPRYLGSPFPPAGLTPLGKRDAFGKLASGYAYVALGECAADLPSELDTALAKIGDAPGLILDMRANNGGGTDHEEVFGRFLAPGQKFAQYAGRGAAHFTGPLVVIVDAGTRSTGETIAGMFKEDGRAYMIGDAPTAGMSATKREITPPSGLFTVRIAVGSNKQRFNGGAGIEGLGVPPHEVVKWDRKLLGEGVDPMLRRAEDLLKSGFPKGAVAYAPPSAKPR